MRITNKQFHKIRKVYQLTTTELANILGYSQSYISDIDRGVEPVTDNVVRRLRDKLGLDEIKLREIELIFERFKIK